MLHTFDELATASEQSVRLLSRAMREADWELCKELARFLAALDDTGATLKEALRMANAVPAQPDGDGDGALAATLEIPNGNTGGGGGSSSGSGSSSSDLRPAESDPAVQYDSDAASSLDSGTASPG